MTIFQAELTTPGTSARIWLVLQVDIAAQEPQNNRTLLNWYLRLEERVNANPYRLTPDSACYGTVSTVVYTTGTLTYDFRGTNVTQNIASGSKYIDHNAETGASSINIEAAFGDGGNLIGDASFQSTMVLPTYPRFSHDFWTGSAWDGDFLDARVGSAWVQQIVEVWTGSAWIKQV